MPPDVRFATETAEGVTLVRFDHRATRNALDRARRASFVELLREVDADPGVRVVVITGTDPAFTSGVDAKQLLEPSYEPLPVDPATALRSLSTPTIAAVNGACVSGGLEIALACSLIVASERATFADTHAVLGLTPGWGLSVGLPAAIGPWRARQLSLTGQPIDAETAHRWGLVNEVVSHESVVARARELAAAIARLDPRSVAHAERLYRDGHEAVYGPARMCRTRRRARRSRVGRRSAASRTHQTWMVACSSADQIIFIKLDKFRSEGGALVLDFREPESVTSLRAQLRALIAEHIPHGFLGAFTANPEDFALTEAFSRELGRRNLLTAAWPREFGGACADVWEQTAVREEMWAAHEPRGAQYMGVNWVGPAIMRYGTPEQQARHLPAIAVGEVVWCQGFSEPGAGSDLPALRTRATKVDGGWSITGQKVWTSYARMAQWCFLLARTGAPGERKAGITVFLLEMDQPGVEVRPIPAMLGEHHLNEVYFDNAWVPDDEVLGEVGAGWDIVTEVLGYERIGIARYARSERLLREAPHALGERWHDLPGSLRERWAAALVRARQARLLAYRLVGDEAANLSPLSAAAYRIVVTTLDQEAAEVLMEMLGHRAVCATEASSFFEREVEDHWRYSQSATVASGTLEMNKQTIAKSLERA